MLATSALRINIPPLEPESLRVAALLLPIVAGTGVELTLVELAPDQFAASCLIPPNPMPIAVTGASRADCLTQLLAALTPTAPTA